MKYSKDKNKVLEGAGYSLFGRCGGLVFSLFFNFFLYRKFDNNDVGLLLLGLAVISMFEPIARCGLAQGVQRFVAVGMEKKSWSKIRGAIIGSFQFSAISIIVVISLIWYFTPELSQYFTKTDHADQLDRFSMIIRTYSFYLIPAVLLTLLLSALRALRDIKSTFYVNDIFIRVSWLVLVLAVGYWHTDLDKMILMIIGFTIITVIGFILAALFFIRKAKEFFRVKSEFNRKALLLFSYPLIFQGILLIFMKQIDKLMIGRYCQTADVAVYNAAAILALQAGFILASFASLFAPMIAGLYHRGDLDGLNHLYKTVARWVMICALPIIALMMVMPDLFLNIFNITNSANAEFVVRILAIGQLISICVGHSGYMLVMSGHTKLTLINNISAAIINVILNIFLIPKYGIIGAAVATTIAIAIRNIASVIEIRFILNASPFSVALIKLFFFIIVCGVGVLLLKNNLPDMRWWIEIPICCATFGIIYTPLMWFFGMDEEDKNFLKTTVLNKLPMK